MQQSKTLGQFYQDYYWWVNSGMPYTTKFDPAWGLCSNLTSWAKSHGIAYSGRNELANELAQQFKDAGLNIHYPFGGYDQYEKETATISHHLNEQRMQWVKDHVPEKSYD